MYLIKPSRIYCGENFKFLVSSWQESAFSSIKNTGACFPGSVTHLKHSRTLYISCDFWRIGVSESTPASCTQVAKWGIFTQHPPSSGHVTSYLHFLCSVVLLDGKDGAVESAAKELYFLFCHLSKLNHLLQTMLSSSFSSYFTPNI